MKKLIISLTIVFTISLVTLIYYQFIFTYMPKHLDFEEFNDWTKYAEEEIIFSNEKTNEKIIFIPIHGSMAFGSNYNMIGLYENKKLIEEIKIGAIPIRLKNWTTDKIIFKVIADRDQELLDFWLQDIDSLGKYKCLFIY